MTSIHTVFCIFVQSWCSLELSWQRGALWGRVVAEELQGWRLDTGHMAKKVSENVCQSCISSSIVGSDALALYTYMLTC